MRRAWGPPIQKIAYRTGLMALSARLKDVRGAVILMYHSVADERLSKWIDPANHVPADIFEYQIDFLAKKRNVIPLAELVEIIRRGDTPPAGTVVITFDDGYLDNLTIAAPILARYHMPATIFLPTGYIDRGETQWIDQIYSIFTYRTNHRIDWPSDTDCPLDLHEPAQAATLYASLCAELIVSEPEKRKALINRLMEECKPESVPSRLTMTWDDIRVLTSDYSVFDLGGHTLEHTDLTRISLKEAEVELGACRERIKDEIHMIPRFFSFCYGRTSELLRRCAEKAGFEAACGGEGIDPVVRRNADVFRLPRVAAPSTRKNFDLKTDYINTGLWRRMS